MPDDLLVCPECGEEIGERAGVYYCMTPCCEMEENPSRLKDVPPILYSEFLRRRMARDLEELAGIGVTLTDAERLARLPEDLQEWVMWNADSRFRNGAWFGDGLLAIDQRRSGYWHREDGSVTYVKPCDESAELGGYLRWFLGMTHSSIGAAELIAAHRKGRGDA